MNENDFDILFLIRYINKMLHHDLNERLRQYGLTSTQGRIIFYISCNESNDIKTSQTDIIDRFSLSKSTVSEMIKRLETKGYVKKVTQEKNKTYIELTDYSKSLIKTFETNREKTKQTLINDLSPSDQEKLKEYLHKMINNMKGEEEPCGNK